MSVIELVVKPFHKVFGSRNDRMVKGYRRRAEHIGLLEPRVCKMSDAQLRDRVAELRKAVAGGEKPAAVQEEVFAIMRESLDRNVGIRNIFNPEHADKFPLDKLPPAVRTQYNRVQEEIAKLQPAAVQGSQELVPGWLRVDIPVEIYEAVREMLPESRPPFRCRPFDVQLIGGMALHEGKIAEMKTGEGKTIVGPLACFMAVIEGLKCHVVTVNDYLVQRDRDWVFPAFYRLGITVGAIHPFHMQDESVKRHMYECDITYGTNSEFGFDYLRDNMKLTVAEQVQKRREFCIVDEIDSILIDEARTPLIISGPAHDDAPQYIKANEVAEHLARLQKQANQETAVRLREAGFIENAAKAHKVPAAQIEKTVGKFRDLGPEYLDEKEAGFIGHTQYYVIRREAKQASMTHTGVEAAQNVVGSRFYVVGNDMGWDHLITNAIRAHAVYEHDREYVVQNGEVIIVDENTGRLMIGRQWSDGLHQAVEAKEARHGVKIKQQTQTLATITIQNFFKLYKRLAGMTGTAMTEATEFYEIYRLDVVQIPTNVSVIRGDADDLIYLTEQAKWDAILHNIVENCEAGRPVLVGTTSVEKSERLSKLLTKKHGIAHEVLNAKQHEREAHIVAQAGQQQTDNRGRNLGNVTIATNMAGRGTDIKLTPAVREAGGLHIIGTERHEARRIDNQLRGRAGRQGDPGSSRFFISMEDDLMKMFAGKTTMRALTMLGMQEGDAIEHRWITRSVERAQRKVEERNFQIRKNLLEYDEVMEYQRNAFYGTRQLVLEGKRIKPLIFDYIAESVEDSVATYVAEEYVPGQVAEAVRSILGVGLEPKRLRAEKLDDVMALIRSDAKADARQEIEISVGEYMSDVPDADDESQDLRGLSGWAMNRFHVDLKISRLKEMTSRQVVEELTAAAHELIERKPLDSLSRFYEPTYPQQQLATWAQEKFGLELTPDELKPHRAESAADAQQRIAELIYNRAVERYQRREIEYPVEFALEMAFGAAQQSPEGSAWAAEQLSTWAGQRYALDYTPQTVTQFSGKQLHDNLVIASGQWHGTKLDAWVTENAGRGADDATVVERFKTRWGRDLDREELARAKDRAGYVREQGLLILRTELTQLERFVLLQILDQGWKDHLYAMDQLKDSVGLRGFAEKDPKIEYKTEGARMFQRMLREMRDKVTGLIFKARLAANVQMRSAYQNQQAHHEVIEDTGVTAGMAAGGTAEQQADQASAQRAGGGAERQVVQPIVNKTPHVGRNDPCPCGSGKKHKHCCGR